MGSSTSLFWGTANDNTVDPATGLTGRQKRIVQTTWAVVRKEPIANGVAIMVAFFKKYPHHQKVFASFKDIPLDELHSNKKFQVHCLNIITTLNNLVDSLNDMPLLEAGLGSMAERHQRRGQTQQQFTDLKDVILEVLKQKFGTKFTSETSEAWSKTIDAMYSVMFKVLST